MKDEAKLLVKIERVLMAIIVHGPEAIFDHVPTLRNFYRHDRLAFGEIAACLRENGMPMHETLDLVTDKHQDDCACWKCIIRLHVDVLKTRAAALSRTAEVYHETL